MTVCEEKTIQVPGFTLALKMWNTKKIKPVLCLHGKLDNAASFDFLAPLLPDFQIAAVDFPGTGFSSQYPEGVIPYWKNDAFLMLQLIKALKWEQFDIIAHSLGSLLATVLAIAKPRQVRKLVFLDILGPTVNFIENATEYLRENVASYLSCDSSVRTIFPDQTSAIKKRMQVGNLSYQAAEALVHRGAIQHKEGWSWTFDPRLQYVSSMLPCEDELRAMFKAIEAPVCLIRASEGVPYPEAIFNARAQSIKNLTVYGVQGGHHVHMDDPVSVSNIISQFLNC